MKISTEYWMKPIPVRCYDWVAVDSDTYDGAPECHCPVGYGATEEEAIADLKSQLEIAVEEIPTIEATAPWDFITTDGAKE